MAKSTQKTILHAAGKVDGKVKTWIVAVFNDQNQAKPYAAMLKLHYTAGNADAVKAMDPSAPMSADGKAATDVKFSASLALYCPEISGLDAEDILG